MGGISMTIEETANSSSPFEPHEWQEGYGLYESGFVQGAEWMLEKAAEWFKNQKEEIGISWFEDFEIRFRKAMKE